MRGRCRGGRVLCVAMLGVAGVACEQAPPPPPTGQGDFLVLDVGGTFGPRSFVDRPDFPEGGDRGALTADGRLGGGSVLALTGVDDDGTFFTRLPNIAGPGVFAVGPGRVELSWSGEGGGTAVGGTLRVDDAGPLRLEATYQVSVDDTGAISATGTLALQQLSEEGPGA